ncbi:MBL fold metallo-hydrolase [Leptospira sp. FAT2]|uniref:MBL fold metallo-hydrolase n=1 Tax=Leptospira sanjuanensis TaxID=2879643 RepID=UPI001EE79799|nr:MBL fold metallo-hydrolase [Leptospira sanjuanensis]MCG6166356.1 MBL fold metallo-hydrolase [Leptospira sanjuanensis]MCG6191748.1 MBL fold metallo-hydrolase [Leptospira sanjuanensis]
MKVKLYGVRGSLPTPLSESEYREKILKILKAAHTAIKQQNGKFSEEEFLSSLDPSLSRTVGGNTTCVYIQARSGDRYIIDCGSGIRQLGNDLLAEGLKPGDKIHILITHTHWDHIQGWMFFKPAYFPGVDIHFYSTIPNLQERFERQQNEENFPLPLSGMMSKKTFHLLEKNQSARIGTVQITPFLLRHPGNCTGFRFEEEGKSFLFCTDVEVQEPDLEEFQDLKKSFGKTDMLIIDAQYSSEEAEKKVGWGHTSGKVAVRCGEILEVERLVLTHHEPDHKDEDILRIFHQESGASAKMQVLLGRENDSFSL